MEEEQREIARVLGKIPSGISILTAGGPRGEGGMLASWVQQAGFTPPAVSIAIAQDRALLATIQSAGVFTLSLLGAEDKALMKAFVRGVEVVPGALDALPGVAIHRAGGLLAIEQAMACLHCRLMGAWDYGGDHLLLAAQVLQARVLREAESFVHLRSNGLRY